MNYLNKTSTQKRWKESDANKHFQNKNLTFSRISTFSNILLVCFYWSGIRDFVDLPSSCNSIGFREHIKTIENKALLFPLQCSKQVFFLLISRSFRRIREKTTAIARNSPRTAEKSNFSLKQKKKLTQTHVHTRNGRLTPKATSTNESILRARKQNGFIFFVLSFTIWESRNKRKLKNKCTHGNNAIFWMKM